MNKVVAVYHNRKGASYPKDAPFHPQENYPEYDFGKLGREPNFAYEYVRSVFHLAGLDRESYGTREWNPLGGLIRPGDRVLLKPNMLSANHPRYEHGWQYVLTHGSIIRAVADYVWKALKGEGKIVVADAPQPETSFENVCRVLGLDRVADFLTSKGVDFELVDLRKTERTVKNEVVVSTRQLIGDPLGYVTFNLADASEFVGHNGAGRYYGADYNSSEVNHHHSDGRHEYELSGTAIACDVFFNLPKLKTHKKVGVTLSLKNLVGVNGNKNFLPHHTDGNPLNGGDQFPTPGLKESSERHIVHLMRNLSLNAPYVGPWVHRHARKIGKRIYGTEDVTIRSGNWHGNNTTWRMCLDLNKIVLYGNTDGSLRAGETNERKRYLSLVDGLIGGQGSGPSNPDPHHSGLVAFGTNPAYVDATCAYLMGFDPQRIPAVRQAFCCHHYPLAEGRWEEVLCVSNHAAWNKSLGTIARDATLGFDPHYGWKEHIELAAAPEIHGTEKV
ncbi:MAG: DUF362 domain-containing protein [Pyrinomonadaceae bacterium]